MVTIEKLSEMNHWWKLGGIKKELSPDYKRKLFFEIKKYLKLRQIIAIVGLRRVGKTTLLYQLIDQFIKENISPKNILYFSFDESIEEIREVMDIYQEEILKKDLSGEKIYIFLDEIQKLKNWQDKIKIYYDLYPNIKFFISGSASLNILLDAKESLAGRIFHFNLNILSFEEFLELKDKNIKKIKENISLWKREIKIELKEYLIKPFPEIINVNDEIGKKYIKESVIEKAIFRDLSALFDVKDIELIEKLINVIASNPGIIINLDDLSKDFGRSRQVISNYLYYLECCFILKSLKNFRGSFRVSSRKLKRYYLIHPCLALSLSNAEEGKIIENLVQFITNAPYFWRERNKEVDFVIIKENQIIPIEVKYVLKVKLKDIKGMIKFLEVFKIKEGFIITGDYEAEDKIKDKKIKFIPLWRWLLTDNNQNHLSKQEK
ncbi:MAG: ATP-binding protein [Nanoarchaeota archaeon]